MEQKNNKIPNELIKIISNITKFIENTDLKYEQNVKTKEQINENK